MQTQPPYETKDFLERLWNSSESLNKRFGIDPQEQDSVKIFMEECKELITAYYNYNATFSDISHSTLDTDLADEFADVIVTAMQIAMARGLSVFDLLRGIDRVVRKNDAKTSETHEIDSGSRKIRRKAPKT